MLVDNIGEITVTNEGATVLKGLQVEHPVAAFADALEIVPRSLAENSGMDPDNQKRRKIVNMAADILTTWIMNTPPASSLIKEKVMRRYVEVDEDEG